MNTGTEAAQGKIGLIKGQHTGLNRVKSMVNVTFFPSRAVRLAGRWMNTRGLQFYTFFGISIGIKRRLIDIAKKITFYFLQNVSKCTVFFAFTFKECKKCYYDPKKFFLEKYQYGYQKNA